MADQEVIKHTKKVYKIWNSKSHSPWEKVKEFIVEIVIIVFAVSLSIWLHGRSEHRHQQAEVKEFLLGLKDDLQHDIAEMNDDKLSYTKQSAIFKYISGVKIKEELNPDSLRRNSQWLTNTTSLNQNNGRFEGFKSSGKIGNIEDKQLQNNIMDLYQEDIPALLMSTNAYINTKNKLLDFGIKNRKRFTDSTSNLTAILKEDEAQNICGFLAGTGEIEARYTNCIHKMEAIIKLIETHYGSDAK